MSEPKSRAERLREKLPDNHHAEIADAAKARMNELTEAT